MMAYIQGILVGSACLVSVLALIIACAAINAKG